MVRLGVWFDEGAIIIGSGREKVELHRSRALCMDDSILFGYDQPSHMEKKKNNNMKTRVGDCSLDEQEQEQE